MTRILEFQPSSEEAVASRVLVLVHQAVDKHFPGAGKATRQFTKTVFAGNPDGGMTLASRPAPDQSRLPMSASAFGTDEVTSPVGRPLDSGAAPPPPGLGPSTGPEPPRYQGKENSAGKMGGPEQASAHTRPTHLETAMEGLEPADSPSWVTRVTLALLLAGLMLLAYVFFA